MTRKKYQATDKLLTSKPMAKMRAIALDPRPTRMFLNGLDKRHDDDATEAAAQAKRERKAAKRKGAL